MWILKKVSRRIRSLIIEKPLSIRVFKFFVKKIYITKIYYNINIFIRKTITKIPTEKRSKRKNRYRHNKTAIFPPVVLHVWFRIYTGTFPHSNYTTHISPPIEMAAVENGSPQLQSALIFLGTGCSSAVPNALCLIRPSDPPCTVCSQSLTLLPEENPNYRSFLYYLLFNFIALWWFLICWSVCLICMLWFRYSVVNLETC